MMINAYDFLASSNVIPTFSEAGKDRDIAFVLQICWGRAKSKHSLKVPFRPTH